MTPDDETPGAPGRSTPDTATGDPLVAVEGVAAAYGDVSVLEGVDLTVERGEFVGLVGPNGAGKTTLLNVINGIHDPDAGSVTVAGEDVHALSSRAASRLVATVPQDTAVAFEFSVEDLVEMGRTPYHGRLSRDPDAKAAVERALERTETAAFRDRSVGSLSGGQRQRVVVARALAQETPALLLDEPTANLDVNHQVRTLELVRDLADEGTGVLAAIHDLDLAARFCDRIALLADGAVRSTGSPEAVFRDGPLEDAFDTAMAVTSNPVTGAPTVTPVQTGDSRDGRCHVVGTGPVARDVVWALYRAGYTVTAGVLPADDVAALAADEAGVETVTHPPFAPLDPDTEASARAQIDRADAVVVAGSVPPALGSLVADADPVVRVGADGTDDPLDGGGPADSAVADRTVDGDGDADADASFPVEGPVAAETLVESVERAVGRPAEADD